MKTFFIEYEVRKIGSIGTWRLLSDYISANDSNEALTVFRDLYDTKFEFRSPYQCYEVKE
jgi:hypothetical protein